MVAGTPSTPRVRPWLRRLALWLCPLLLLILALQVWDRIEERRLAEAVAGLRAARPAAATTSDNSDAIAVPGAGAHYLAAQHLSYVPIGAVPMLEALREAVETGRTLPPETQQAVAAITERNRTAYGLLDLAADLPLETVDGRALDTQLVRWQPSRSIDMAASFRTLEQLLSGQTDAAAATLVGRIQLLRVFSRRPSLLYAILKSSIADAIVTDLSLVLSRPGVSSARLGEIDRALAGVVADEELEASVHAVGLWLQQMGSELWGARGLQPPWLRRRGTAMAKTSLDALDIARLPWPARLSGMATLPLHQMRWPGSRDIMGGEPFTSSWAREEYERLALSVARLVATVNTTRAAIRVEQYRREHGALPAGLDALAPGTDEDWRVDPFSGGSLLLKTDGRIFVVYSVGEDGRDDGGQVEPAPRAFDAPGVARRGPDHGIRMR